MQTPWPKGFAAQLEALASDKRRARKEMRRTGLVVWAEPSLMQSPQASDMQEWLDETKTHFKPLERPEFIPELSHHQLHVLGIFEEAQSIYHLAFQLNVVLSRMTYHALPMLLYAVDYLKDTSVTRCRLEGALEEYHQILKEIGEKLRHCADVLRCFERSEFRKYEEIRGSTISRPVQQSLTDNCLHRDDQSESKVTEVNSSISAFNASFHLSVAIMEKLLSSVDALSYRLSDVDHATTVMVKSRYEKIFETFIDQPLTKAKGHLAAGLDVVHEMNDKLTNGC